MDACTKIKSVRDIDKITVERRYDAWGEFADLVADNDELREYAEKYIKSEGIEKERAEAEMITYIHTAVDARGESFGANSIENLLSVLSKISSPQSNHKLLKNLSLAL